MAIREADLKFKTEKKCKYCEHYQWDEGCLSGNLHPCGRFLSSGEVEGAIMIIGRYSQVLYGPEFGCIHFVQAKRTAERLFDKPEIPKPSLCVSCFNLIPREKICAVRHLKVQEAYVSSCVEYYSDSTLCFSCSYHYPDRENLLGTEDKPCVICLENRPKAVRLPVNSSCPEFTRQIDSFFTKEGVIDRIIEGRKHQFREIRKNMIAEEIAGIDFSIPLDYKKYYAKPRNEEPEICRTCFYHKKIGPINSLTDRQETVILTGSCILSKNMFFSQDAHTCHKWAEKSKKKYSEGTI